VLDLDAVMTPSLTLGYRTTRPATGSWMPDVEVTGHEFHRTVVEPRSGAHAAWVVDGVPEGFATASSVASYLHLHPAGVPSLATGLVDAARKVAV
jgi:cobyrinic acid a,c-diamide synthase